MQNRFFTFNNQGMTGVVSTLKASHQGYLICQ